MPKPLRTLLHLAILLAAIPTAPSFGQTYLPGIDVSIHQGMVDWTKVRDAGIEFAFARATRGETYSDPVFLANMRGAAEAGVLIGPYHYCNLDTNYGDPNDAIVEANNFLSVIKPYYDAGSLLPPVADVEGFPNFSSNAEGKAYTSAWVQKFSDTIYNSIGVRPLIYGSLSKVSGVENRYTTEVANQHDLWLTWYKHSTANPPTAANTPLWGPWTFWQWTDGSQNADGTTPGYRVDGIVGAVDGDLFNGMRSQLENLLVGSGPLGGVPDGLIMVNDFNTNEGYFNEIPTPTQSGSNKNLTSIDAVQTTSQHFEGAGSERIDVDGANWTFRFLSGIESPLANPASNLKLDSTGSIGFWLKTTSAGVTVQLAIDDPVAASTGAIEGSTVSNVIADNQWHLYEWDFEDAADWNSFFGGDGVISNQRVTIDSIVLKGASTSTIYLDMLAHNPNGSLVPIAGDFNGDYLVDGGDLDAWKAAMGVSDAGDADGDGDSDGADMLVWQRNQTAVIATVATAAVPEPTSLTLACLVATVGWRHRRRAG